MGCIICGADHTQYCESCQPRTVPCKWCGNDTVMLGTQECDSCWELRTKMSKDPLLTKKILESCMDEEVHRNIINKNIK